MFTGLIEATGKLVSRAHTGGAPLLIVNAPALAGRWREGDSIAVNGVCLTALVVEDEPAHFAADLAAETLARTTLGSLPTGAVLNLELPTPAGSPLGGHVVQGHVDATATVVSFDPLAGNPDTTDWRLTLELPAVLAAAVVSQGSITVDGISLTVAKVRPAQDRIFVEIAIIPHTCAATNLRALAPGSSVNIETDVLAKYAAQMASTSNPEPALTVASLLASGY
jgi:riboflavin synthase